MPNDIVTVQGLAWDNIALDKGGSEKLMGQLLTENVEEMDVLLFSGGLIAHVPAMKISLSRSLPPWERL